MPIEPIETIVSSGPTLGKKLGNLTLEKARFFGRPNFSGEVDRFGDDRRKFTVMIPNDVADQLREMGWNVKTIIPTEEEKAEGRETVSCLKVMVDDISIIQVRMGQDITTLQPGDKKGNPGTFGVMDRSRIEEMDMEIRAWEYKPEEKPGEYSARLVALVATLRFNRLEEKYGILS